MCHFVTAYVPKDANIVATEALFDQNKFGFKLLDNPNVQKQLSCPVIQVLTTRSSCDCGTRLASATQFVRDESPNKRDIEKLRDKGWSESRIRRWLDEKAAAAERYEAAELQHSPKPGPETARWVRMIGQLIGSHSAGWVGILVHEYSGGLNSERITLQSHKSIQLASLTEDTLLEMGEDTMLIVYA